MLSAKRKRCSEEGCAKQAVQGGVCAAHGVKKKRCIQEVPHALKRLEKSMIEKIESEILDSCESVTFDDIAGL